MHVIILLVYFVLASAAPRHTDNSQEKDDFFPRGSPRKQTLPQLNPLVRKDPHPAALYSEDEIKEYLRNLGDSIPHVSDDMFKAQKEDGPGDSAWNDPASAPADADEGLAPEVYKQGLKNPALNAKPEMDSGDWDTRDPFLADQGQNLEDPADARMPKPADSKKRDKITILIDALRIRNENKRYSRYGRVNDQHDNAAAYPRQWESPEPNGYYGRHTRRSSSPSAEALAMLTQKLSKLQVEVGRLKEVVLLQGAVHIKTSERMEMMLLTQGKLAVKNNLDTRRVLKRVRRCCSCSLRAKRKRALALRLARNGHTRDKSDKEIPRSSDSSPVMNMSFPDKDNNVNEINRQNNGKSDQPQVVERSQSDSHSRGKKNSPSLQIDHRDDGNVREKDKHGADSDQSRKTETDLPQDNHTVDSTTSGFSLSSQQATKSSGTTLGNQYDSNSDSNQPTTVQIDRNQEAPVAQKSADQKDRQRQVATSSEAPTTTTVPTSVDDWTTEAGNSYEVEITSSDRPSTSALNQPRTSPTLVKRLFTVASTAVDKNVQTIHSNGQNTSGSSTWKWSLAADASTTAKKSAASPESSSLLTVLNESKNQHTQIPVLGEPTRSPILDASGPQDEVVTGSNRKQEDVTEEHPNKQSYNGLDPKTTTPQHMSVTGKATQVMSTAAIDNLSEDERVDEQNVNTNSANYPTAGSTPLSDRYHGFSIPPQQVRNDMSTPYSTASVFVNTTSSSKVSGETNVMHSSTDLSRDSANIRQHVTNTLNNLNTDERHNNHQDGVELSTKEYSANPTLSDVYANLKSESQNRGHASKSVLSVNVQQPTKTSLHSAHKNGDVSTKAKGHNSDTSYTNGLPKHSTTAYNTTSRKRALISNPAISTPLSEPVASTYGNEKMTESPEDVHHNILSTTTSYQSSQDKSRSQEDLLSVGELQRENKDDDIAHQSSSSVPVTTTLARRPSRPSTIVSTPKSTTSTFAKSSPPSSFATTTRKSEWALKKTSSPPPTFVDSATSHDRTVSMTETITAAATTTASATATTASATTTTASTATVANMPSTRRKTTETAGPAVSETTSTTPIPTTTEEVEPELAVDLSTGQIRNDNLPGATWVVLPSRSTKRKRSVSATAASSGNQLCDMKGVVKFTFTPPHTPSRRRRRHRDGGDDDDGGGDGGRRRLLLEMEFRRPYRWVFNIGDSSANNGFSGDGSVQENDCEAQGYGQAFAVYASDKHTNGRQKLLKMADHFIHDKLTLVISDQSISWDNHRGNAANLTHNSLFALSGQYDRQGPVNYDVYLGFNRVIAGHYRRGHGLCRVTARWLKG